MWFKNGLKAQKPLAQGVWKDVTTQHPYRKLLVNKA